MQIYKKYDKINKKFQEVRQMTEKELKQFTKELIESK